MVFSFYCHSIIGVPISPLYTPPPFLPLPPTFSPPPHPPSLCPWVLQTWALTTRPLLSAIIPVSPPLWSLSVCSFFPMSLVLVCLLVCFVDQVPLIGEIIWYLSFTAWLVSLSIMLPSSIHAVLKDRSSFFSLLCSILLCKCTTIF